MFGILILQLGLLEEVDQVYQDFEFKEDIMRQKVTQFKKQYKSDITEIVEWMLIKDVTKRKTFQEIYQIMKFNLMLDDDDHDDNKQQELVSLNQSVIDRYKDGYHENDQLDLDGYVK